MRRIALINQKGGVGKTTTAVNLGAALALAGQRVVLVDLDPQANLTLSLGIELAAGAPSSYRVLTGEVAFGAALRPTSTPNLRVLPTDIHLSGADLELAETEGREQLLRNALDAWRAEHRAKNAGAEPADYLLFDCPPSLGLLSLNALAAAGEVFLVVQTQFLALQGMSRLVEVIELVKQSLNPGLRLAGIVPCMYDSRMRLAREVLSELRRYFPSQVFRTPISANVKLAEAPSFAKTIFEYAPESIGARDFASLSHEVLAQVVLSQAAAPGEPGGAGATAAKAKSRVRTKLVLPVPPPSDEPPPASIPETRPRRAKPAPKPVKDGTSNPPAVVLVRPPAPPAQSREAAAAPVESVASARIDSARRGRSKPASSG